MTEPKNIEPDLPEEETLAFDEPPTPAEDPPYEDDDAPDLPDEPEAEPDFEPLFEPDVDVAAEPEPEPEPEFEPLPEPEPEPVTDLQPEPDPEPELYEPELFEDEPAVAEPVEAEAAPEEVEPAEAEAVRAEPSAPPPPPPRRARPADVVEDLHGPEPWDEAPVTPLVPAAPEPVPTAPVAIAEAQQQAGQEIPLTGATAYEIKRAGYAVYLLYLSGLVAPVLPLIVGVMFASNRVKDAPAWLQSHYTFQIRTFWITLAALGAACLLLFLPFGLFPLTIVATAVWLVMRCFVGMVRLHRGEPIFNPQTWTV